MNGPALHGSRNAAHLLALSSYHQECVHGGLQLLDRATGRVLVEVSPDFYRPTDVVNLWGDPSKAKRELGWDPMKTSFEELVKIMVDADMAKVAVERAGDEIRMNLAEYLEKGIVK